MADVKLAYGTPADVTITLASLASDTNLLAGQESDAVVNTTTLALDYLASGKIMTGTTPTTARQIEIWCVGRWDATNWSDVFDGTNSAETITNIEIKTSICRLVASIPTTATSNVSYSFGPVSIAQLFGGVLPQAFSLFSTHNTVAALNSTGSNHLIRVQPIFQTVT